MADLVFILRLVSTRAIYILGVRDGKRRTVPSNGVTLGVTVFGTFSFITSL